MAAPAPSRRGVGTRGFNAASATVAGRRSRCPHTAWSGACGVKRPGMSGDSERGSWQASLVIDADARETLHGYLRSAREALLWKLEGLSEYDIRRPLTPTGTNLLGLVKHLSIVEARYFGETFGRPFPEHLPWWDDDAEPNADGWATEDETRAQIVDCYRRVWKHADATIGALALDAPGRVLWWGSAEVTLHQILVHVLAETNRHAGHADILREGLDGSAGMSADNSNLPEHDAAWWENYRARIEQAARAAEPVSNTKMDSKPSTASPP
jgi:hypothetical protein